MKKFFLGFFATLLCIGAVIADDSAAPVSIGRAGFSRAIPAAAAPEQAEPHISEPATTRTATVSRNAATAPTIGRSAISRAANADAANRESLESVAGNVGRSARTSAASINNSANVRRAGVSLRPSTAEVGGRATIGDTGVMTGSNFGAESARAVQTRAATISKESISESMERLNATADLNKSCQTQYNDCMDQFCAVIDANQKRCSCSGNISRYAKVETAVKEANSQLNEVAQRIRYVGLSADEIRAIMSATEAEEVLSGTKDNTESRNMLDTIEKLIKNPTSTASVADAGTGLDMDLTFSADASDLFSLDFLGNSSGSFSNLRGTDLYNAAKKRCNTVLTQCKNVGATSTQITGNYDLAIDKDCIAYEQGLTKMNESLKSNVRSAGQMLQKARLAVLQNKNQYDAKGCIGALDTCMKDEMVCGGDYFKCLDPTKRYIDENGEVVLGQNISDIIQFMETYNNANINPTTLAAARSTPMTTDSCKSGDNKDGRCVMRYLMEKIGMGKLATDGGLCRAVLDKCQRTSYQNNAYNPYNDVVVNYMQRAMTNIKAAQHTIISDYASSCMTGIAQCYNQQVSQVNSWSNTANTNNVYNVMRGACYNVSLTCAYAVFKDGLPSNATGNTQNDKYINAISEMFYQSLLCPENSQYVDKTKSICTLGSGTTQRTCTTGGIVCNYTVSTGACSASGTGNTCSVSGNICTVSSDGFTFTNMINNQCQCNTGYEPFGTSCLKTCDANTPYRNASGLCTTCPTGTKWLSNECKTISCGVNATYNPQATAIRVGSSTITEIFAATAPSGSGAFCECTYPGKMSDNNGNCPTS
ncbi:MAG: hypothetical protein LBJ18_04410 [Rickettsiales bacterium]|jgi:hypothetical protein|nr:hypothetical protein [Rickettsiales bacterium]